MLTLTLIVLGAYLIGSLSPGLWLARRAGVDPRERGSGSTGGTNVARLLGWHVGLPVVALDMGKGFAAVWLARHIRVDSIAVGGETLALVAGLAVVVGHAWPVFTGLRGGKGVAVLGGALLALEPFAGVICVAIFVAVLAASRIMSVASVGAAASVPVVLAAMTAVGRGGGAATVAWGAVQAALIAYLHRGNLRRLKEGREPRVGH